MVVRKGWLVSVQIKLYTWIICLILIFRSLPTFLIVPRKINKNILAIIRAIFVCWWLQYYKNVLYYVIYSRMYICMRTRTEWTMHAEIDKSSTKSIRYFRKNQKSTIVNTIFSLQVVKILWLTQWACIYSNDGEMAKVKVKMFCQIMTTKYEWEWHYLFINTIGHEASNSFMTGTISKGWNDTWINIGWNDWVGIQSDTQAHT